MARTKRNTTLTRIAQLAVAAPQVVAIRTARMMAAGANPGAADRTEFKQMHTEKVQAFWESMFGMAAQAGRAQQEYARSAAMQWMRMWTTPWVGGSGAAAKAAAALVPLPTRAQRKRAVANIVAAAVKPVHKRATGNARRLTRGKKR